ncbi:MAG: hypothetical protein WCI51_07405 [Lentisphaerota bacterium]
MKNDIKGCKLIKLSCSFKGVDAESRSSFELNDLSGSMREQNQKQAKGSS